MVVPAFKEAPAARAARETTGALIRLTLRMRISQRTFTSTHAADAEVGVGSAELADGAAMLGKVATAAAVPAPVPVTSDRVMAEMDITAEWEGKAVKAAWVDPAVREVKAVTYRFQSRLRSSARSAPIILAGQEGFQVLEVLAVHLELTDPREKGISQVLTQVAVL
jgi:hypothetical protein